MKTERTTSKPKLLAIAALLIALVACTPLTTDLDTPPSTSVPAIGASGQIAPASATETEIRQVIEWANAQQVQAFVSGDPSLMADTAGAAYYQELVQINQSLRSGGVTAITLDSIEWRAVTVEGSNATATTIETWTSTYRDGSTVQSRDQNDYTLVLTTGSWRIVSDVHSDIAPPSDDGGQTAPATVPANSETSRNWSGYAATAGTYTVVSGTWTVPQPTGTTGVGATWVGIGGYSSQDLIQAGTEETVLASGRVQYAAWIEMLPQASQRISLTVNPGDSVTVSIVEQQPGSWQITMRNNTTGQNYQQTVAYTSSRSSAEWVVEAPSTGRTILPIDSFGTVTFTGAGVTVNGRSIGIAQSGAQPITMTNARGQALAVPTTLTSDGFSVNRTDAPAASQTVTGTARRRF